MALPQIKTPEYECVLPSNGETILFRPFLMKEEKILLTVLEGNDPKEMQRAMIRIIRDCVLSDIDIEKLPFFDLEYIFLQLRAKSVGEVIELKLAHPEPETECEHMQEVSVNISDIEVNKEDCKNPVIQFENGIGVKMKYPNLKDIENVKDSDNEFENGIQTLSICIESVFDEEQVYTDFTEEELQEFIESLSQTHIEKMVGFMNNMPQLEHTIEYTCEACGKTESINVKGLSNFFT